MSEVIELVRAAYNEDEPVLGQLESALRAVPSELRGNRAVLLLTVPNAAFDAYASAMLERFAPTTMEGETEFQRDFRRLHLRDRRPLKYSGVVTIPREQDEIVLTGPDSPTPRINPVDQPKPRVRITNYDDQGNVVED